MKARTRTEIYEWVFGQNCCDYPPDGWEDMDDDLVAEWLDENKWEMVEYWDTDALLEQIYTTADSLCNFLDIK